MSRGGSVEAISPLCISALSFITAPKMNMATIVTPSSAHDELAVREVEQKKKTYQIQVTENRNLLLLEVFHQSRRLCIISYKSPIQTELME